MISSQILLFAPSLLMRRWTLWPRDIQGGKSGNTWLVGKTGLDNCSINKFQKVTETGVRKTKHPLLAYQICCRCAKEITHNSVKVSRSWKQDVFSDSNTSDGPYEDKMLMFHILKSPYLQFHVMYVKHDEILDKLTRQVWLRYHHAHFEYWTCIVSMIRGMPLRTHNQEDRKPLE